MALQNIEANITLDLYNHDTTPTTIKAIQLDSETRYVAARLQNMGAQYDVDSGATVQLTVIRPDKVGVQIAGTTFTYGDEGAQYLGPYAELTLVALAVSGKLLGQFKLTSGDQILRTEIFTISAGVALDASTDEWAGEYDGYNLDELVEKVDAAVEKVDGMEADVTELKSGFSDLYNTAYVTDSANGGVSHFVDGADDVPLKSLKVNIVPAQSGSGDPSPSNVRPISGRNSVKVTRAGKNLLPMEIQSGSYGNGVTITVNPDLSITYNKPNETNWTANVLGTFMLQAGTYTLIEDADGSQNARISLKKLPDNTEIVNTRWTKRLTFTLTEATQIYADFSRASQATDLVIKFMIFKGNTATASDYEPYKGNTYDISLASAGTVYGGTLDVVSGELKVTHGYIASYSGQELPSAWISDRDVYAEGTRPTTGAQVVYQLATPITYNLTPAEVKSLLGINNIWSDAGDVDVEYRADTKLYIDKRIAEVTS